jgi:hypothetical protein
MPCDSAFLFLGLFNSNIATPVSPIETTRLDGSKVWRLIARFVSMGDPCCLILAGAWYFSFLLLTVEILATTLLRSLD